MVLSISSICSYEFLLAMDSLSLVSLQVSCLLCFFEKGNMLFINLTAFYPIDIIVSTELASFPLLFHPRDDLSCYFPGKIPIINKLILQKSSA